LVEVIARALVDKPDEVKVSSEIKGRTEFIKLKVADGDMGRVIGRKGKIAKSIRTVVTAAASKTDRKIIVDIVD
jgi:hypothetical protein